MFQPFSQENPLQTGTGLGLAIVNSIGTSLGGRVEVWSAEGVGTEIRLIMEVDLVDRPNPPTRIVDPSHSVTVSMVGFDQDHRGVALLKETTMGYLTSWWGFTIADDKDSINGDILLVNEDVDFIQELTAAREFARPVILLSAARGDEQLMSATTAFERMGGWCRIVFKPSGPVRLGEALTTAVYKMEGLRQSPPSTSSRTTSSYMSAQEYSTIGGDSDSDNLQDVPYTRPGKNRLGVISKSQPSPLTRRRSEEHRDRTPRPPIGNRSSTFTGTPLRLELSSRSSPALSTSSTEASTPNHLYSVPSRSLSTLSVAEDGSTMLKSAFGSNSNQKPVVMLVDDNIINRNLLAHWLNRRVRFSFSGSDVVLSLLAQCRPMNSTKHVMVKKPLTSTTSILLASSSKSAVKQRVSYELTWIYSGQTNCFWVVVLADHASLTLAL